MISKVKRKIGFTCGAMDLFHAGHYLMLAEIRPQCEYLIVGLHTDPSIDRPEKHKPIQTVEERLIQLKGCKYIDEIIIYDTEEDLYQLLKELNPDVRFMGEDWKDKPNYSRDLLPDIEVIYNSRCHDFSSSNLRARIVERESKENK
ncbi:MAG: adenylyltransferase/cytidyltransferase family protein [Patescibacteria group bacterium]